MYIEDNNLSGGIPTEWGQMMSLKGLDLDDNANIGGTMPTELGKLTNLQHLELFRTGLAGPIITEIGLMTRLNKVELGTFHKTFHISFLIPTILGCKNVIVIVECHIPDFFFFIFWYNSS